MARCLIKSHVCGEGSKQGSGVSTATHELVGPLDTHTHTHTLLEFSVCEDRGQVACGRKYDPEGWGCLWILPHSLVYECLSCFSYAALSAALCVCVCVDYQRLLLLLRLNSSVVWRR